jgi:hypothetical protein
MFFKKRKNCQILHEKHNHPKFWFEKRCFFNWKIGEITTFRNTIVQKFTKIIGLKKDYEFLIVS